MPPLRLVPRAISGHLLARSPWFPQALPPGSPCTKTITHFMGAYPPPGAAWRPPQTPPLMRGGCRPLALPAPDHLPARCPQYLGWVTTEAPPPSLAGSVFPLFCVAARPPQGVGYAA